MAWWGSSGVGVTMRWGRVIGGGLQDELMSDSGFVYPETDAN